jgi:hypothetical protein
VAESVGCWEAAAPFLIAGGLLVLGSGMGELAGREVMKYYRAAFDKADLSDPHYEPDLEPTTVRSCIDWAVDGSQIVVVLVAAVSAIILLGETTSRALDLLYVAVAIACVVAGTVFLMVVDPRTYHVWPLLGTLSSTVKVRKRGFMTPVAIVGVVINGILAAVAALVA